jgi:hypothetical protein
MKDERGFALILFVALLPLMLAGGACLFMMMGLLEDRFSRQNMCRRHLLTGLEKSGITMKEVLALNPTARSLRIQIAATNLALAAAIASGNQPAATVAAKRLRILRGQQKMLDLRQRALLLKARSELSTAQLLAFGALRSTSGGFVQITATFPQPVRAALRPNLSGPGPVYVLEKGFERKQALVQKWQSRFQLHGPLANFLNARGRFEEKCAATLIPEGLRWRARLAEDRS